MSLEITGINYSQSNVESLSFYSDLGSQSFSVSITGEGKTAQIEFSSPASSKYFYGQSAPNELTTPINFGDRWYSSSTNSEFVWSPVFPDKSYLNYVYTDGLTTNGYWTNETYSGTTLKLDPNSADDFAASASFSGLGFTTPNESSAGITTTYPNTYYPSANPGDYFLVGYTSGSDIVTLLLEKQSDNTWKDIRTSDPGYEGEIYYATNTEKYYLGGGLGSLVGTTILWYDISAIDYYLNYRNVSSVIDGKTYLIQQNKYEDFIKGTYDPIEDKVPPLSGSWERVLSGGSKYFYGPSAPSEAEGVTMGSKWFNTSLGLEFTYIIENDSTQWIITNVAGISGNVGEGSGSQGFQGFQGLMGITGTQGFQGFQGLMGITGTQGFQGFQGSIGITGTQGFQGFQGNIGITGTQGFQGFQGFQGSKGSGKYFYGPTAPESTDDGLTLGSKWFNTTVGVEFTYIVEGDDTSQWVMVNVFSATGPQGPLGGGTGNQGFQGFQGNIGTTGEGYTSAEIRDNYLYVTKVFSDGTTSEVNLGYIGPTGSGFVFDADITAAFGPNKTFGKYEDGDLIPALGKTAVQVIKEALFDVLNPTVSLTSPTSIQFNQTSISNVLNYSHTINTLGAGIASGTIEWKRANESTYTPLINATNSSGSHTHNTTNTEFNTNAFNYKYTVIDTAGGSASADLTINVQAYSAPSVSIVQTGVSVISPETNTKREKGNVATNISAQITRNSALVPITDWKFEYNENNEAWTNTGFTGSVNGDPVSFNTGTTTHSPNNTINIVRYRVVVTDSYNSTNSNPAAQINFANLIFYGATSSYPSNGNDIRAMSDRKFIDDGISSFTLNTGTADNVFVASIPDPYEIIKVIDEATNAEITNEYIFNTNITTVNDFAGNSVNHNVYIMNPAIAYSDGNHPHKITRST